MKEVKMRKVITIGQVYRIKHPRYISKEHTVIGILCQVDDSKVALIIIQDLYGKMKDFNRQTSPVKVNDVFNITQKEFNKIVGNDQTGHCGYDCTLLDSYQVNLKSYVPTES